MNIVHQLIKDCIRAAEEKINKTEKYIAKLEKDLLEYEPNYECKFYNRKGN